MSIAQREDPQVPQQTRSVLIDVIKGVAIFLMLWGHCIQYCYPAGVDFFADTAFKAIYSFHMPLFMLVSGYLFCRSSAKYNGKNLIRKKAAALIMPLVGGSVLIFLCTTLLLSLIGGNISLEILKRFISGFTTLWFLWSLLAATVVMCFVELLYRKNRSAYLIAIVLIAGFFFVGLLPNRQQNMVMYPYFVLGYFYARKKPKFAGKGWVRCAACAAYLLMLCFYEEKFYTTEIFGSAHSVGEYVFIDAFRWGIGLAGSVFAIEGARLLLKVPGLKRFVSVLADLGKKSLQIYILSVIFLSAYLPMGMHFLRKISAFAPIDQLFLSHAVLYDCVLTLMIAMAYAVVLLWIAKILEKLKISKFVFGR